MAQIEYTDEDVQKGVKKYFETIAFWAPEQLHNEEMVTYLIEQILDAMAEEQ